MLHHLEQAFPNGESPAIVVIQADDTTSPAVTQAIAKLRNEALASGVAHQPVSIDTNKSAHGHHGGVAAGRKRHATTRPSRPSTLCGIELIPQTIGQVDGVQANVTGETAVNKDQMDRADPATPRSCSGSCSAWRSSCCWSRSARS